MQVENKLSRTQKTGFVLLFVFTILVVGLGFLQMRNNIYNPFALKVDAQNTSFGVNDENVRLQSIDTDHDGINDYEELYFFETSPYLPDTDSDGIGDKQEIDEGTDPNCAEDKVCEQVEDINTLTSSSSTASILGVQGSEIPGQNSAGDLQDLQTILQSPEEIRKLLLSTGQISEEQLSQIDDDALMGLVQTMLTQGQQNTN